MPPRPPWEARTSKPARRPLSAERIVEAALKVLVRDGYDAVSMRRVAQELGTGAASLYAHVAGKRELDNLMIDRVAKDLEIPDPDPDRWQEQIRDVMRGLLEVMRSYPGVARAAIGNVPLGEKSLVTSDRMLGILRAGGVPDQQAAYAVDLISLYVCAIAFEESVQGAGKWTEEGIREWVAQMTSYFRNLPADRFPNITALAAALTAGAGDERFEFGTQVIVAGIASFVPAEPAG